LTYATTPTVTPPGPGISIPASTLNKQPSNTANPNPQQQQQPKPTTPIQTDPCVAFKGQPSTYAFCRQQHGLPPAPAVGFGGVYNDGANDDYYYNYGYGYRYDDYYYDYGDDSSIDSSLKDRKITIA
jgi:hypothetical protein